MAASNERRVRVEAFSKSSSNERPARVWTTSRASQGRLLQVFEEPGKPRHRGGRDPAVFSVSRNALNLLLDLLGSGSACVALSRHRSCRVGDGENLGGEAGIDFQGELQRRLRERNAALRALSNQRPGQLVRGAKGHSALGQGFGEIGR